jgi:hypothetical protein
MNTEKENIEYRYDFSETEIIEIRERVAKLVYEKNRQEALRKEEMDRFKDKIKGLEAEIASLAIKSKNRFEHRWDICEKVIDHVSGEVSYLLNGVVVKTRKTTREEHQRELELTSN